MTLFAWLDCVELLELREYIKNVDEELLEFYENIYIPNEINNKIPCGRYSCSFDDPRWLEIYYDVHGKYLSYYSKTDISDLPKIVEEVCENDASLIEKVNGYLSCYREYDIRVAPGSLYDLVNKFKSYSRSGFKRRMRF